MLNMFSSVQQISTARVYYWCKSALLLDKLLTLQATPSHFSHNQATYTCMWVYMQTGWAHKCIWKHQYHTSCGPHFAVNTRFNPFNIYLIFWNPFMYYICLILHVHHIHSGQFTYRHPRAKNVYCQIEVQKSGISCKNMKRLSS